MSLIVSRPPSQSKETFQFSTSAVRCERAASELRYGRPVVVRGPDKTLAVLAVDAVSPSVYDQFARIAGGQHCLYLPQTRALKLGVAARGGISIPLNGTHFPAVSRLAYGPEEPCPARWAAASDLMAVAGDLARLSLLLPAMVCVEIPSVSLDFDACCDVGVHDLARSRDNRQHFEIVVRTPVPLKDLGNCEFVVFRGGLAQKDQVAIVVGNPDLSAPVPLRIHSSCLTGDLCGSLKCDCGDQLRNGLVALQQAGGGVLVYLDQEGRGTGIGAKMRAYGHQNRGYDTIDADAILGFLPDERRYEAAAAILGLLGISRVQLLTNNPAKIAALMGYGIDVAGRLAVTGRVTAENENYLRTKSVRAGHLLDLATLTVVHEKKGPSP